MRRLMSWIAAVLIFVAVAGVLYMRLAAPTPGGHHVDPRVAERTGRPNDILLADVAGATGPAVLVPLPPAEVIARLKENALQEPKTRLLSETAPGLVTFIQRTPWMSYPDVISLQAAPAQNGGTRLSIYARAIYGYRDFGVNADRVERWLAALRN